jgi:glyoxylase-like metal-dependent hydrolase (beta-lactamase superfamily II)
MKKLDPGGPPEQVSPNCRRIPLPDPFVPGVTSVFVLDSEAGSPPWLLDSGADIPESVAALRAGLDFLSITPETASGVVLSHTHLDHAGGLLRWRPARLLAHENAVTEMRNLQPASSRGRTALRSMGVPAEVACDLAPEVEPVGDTPFARTPVSDRVSGPDGAIADSGGWRWILAEGHAPGHLMAFHPEDRLLLVGDQFLHRWKTPIRISDPEEDSFGLYLASLERALQLEPHIVCSSHTGAIRPAIPFLEDRRGVLDRQLERTRDAVRRGSTTAWDVVAGGGNRRPSGGLLILYLRERLAMLRHLAAGGELVRQLHDGVEQFESA